MTMLKQIEKEKQFIARCEKSLILDKLKQRKTDTRRKIEFGGLVIKSGMNAYNKSIILGGLTHVGALIESDLNYLKLFESLGNNLFIEK